VDGQRHAPAALTPGKNRYPLYRRLGGHQGRSGRVRKISPPPGFDPRTVQPVASRYTDWANPALETFQVLTYCTHITPRIQSRLANLQPSVTSTVSVIHLNKHSMSTEYNMANLLVHNMFINYNLSHLKTAHSKPIFLCVLSSSIRPTATSFNGTSSVAYCLKMTAL
jgi:hypothetical protein